MRSERFSHRHDLKRAAVPLQVHTAIDPSGFWRRTARHRKPAAVLLVRQDADLQMVQFPTYCFRTHRMSECLEPVAHVLNTAKRHVADGDMGSDAPR